jgi:hypothetical protein
VTAGTNITVSSGEVSLSSDAHIDCGTY